MRRIALFIAVVALMGAIHAPALADDTALFAAEVAPDTLIILDMSRSMNFDVSGKNEYASPPNRRIDIARKVLFDLLDDNDNNAIDQDDEKTLEARLGYMRFRSALIDESGDPMTGNIRVLAPVGSSFKDIWGKISDPKEQNGDGGTPLAGSLSEAKTYFTKYATPSDPAAACRKKFVILITDGEDTYACSGNGSPGESANPGMHKRRMLTVQRAKELNASGIQVFVVGFGGDLPDELKKTLNWAAKYGGTDNPLEGNTQGPTFYDITQFGSPCTAGTTADPANFPLTGYAFLAADAAQLSQALKSILGHIQERAYSFTVPTVPSIRTVDEDTLYLSSFTPSETPFWQGTLKAYRLNADGTLPVDGNGNPTNPLWAATQDRSSVRRIYTTLGSSGAMVEFNAENLSKEDLGVTEAERLKLINHIRGIDSYDINKNGIVNEEREWKLGDIFHSSAVVVGAPSSSFEDFGFSGPGGFYEANRNRPKVLVAGANDGMLHAFNASTGKEEWAFIPNGLLKTLKLMAATHTYYVDGSPKVVDAWLYSNANDEDKSVDEWKTVLVCGLRKGGNTYFALDITDTRDTKDPKFLWEFPKATDTATLEKVGQSWSEPAVGRVKVEDEEGEKLVERWVAFIGGGFDKSEGVGEANVGRAFFVVDLKTGKILWEFSFSGSEEKKNRMIHSFPAPPKAADLNFDGYVDRVYLGDLGGQMWVFDVSFDEVRKKSNSQWNGKRLFRAPGEKPEKHPIYYPPAVALDPSGTPWVFWGTGDRENPTEKNSKERFYAVKDDERGEYPYEEKDLLDVTNNNTFSQDSSKKGWFIKLAKSEKVLAKPTVFSRLVYFTTYTHTEPDPCKVSGEGRLYTVEYLSGGGAVKFSDSDYAAGITSVRSKIVGSGVPSAPVITVNTQGKTSVIIGTTLGEVFSEGIFSLPSGNEVLYWREVIP